MSMVLWAGCDRPQAPSFTEDIRIDGAGVDNDPDSVGTRMCTAPDGTVYVLWLDDRDQPDEERYDIWLNRSLLAPTRTWLAGPVRVSHGDGQISAPDLYCAAEGVFVVWEDDRDGELQNRQVYFNRSVDQGETFLPEDIPIDADPDGLTMSFEPRIAGTGEDLYVAWYDDRNGAYDVFVTQSSTLGDAWSAPIRVDQDLLGGAYSAHPRIAVGDDGRTVWVVWEDSRDGVADIWFARSTDGAVTFDDDQRLDGGDDLTGSGHASFAPKLCSDGSEHVHAVWHDSRNGEGHDILATYSGDAGATWTMPVRLDGDAAGFGDSVDPVCLATGSTLHAAWSDKLGPTFDYDIYTRDLVAGIPGNGPFRLDTGRPEGYSRSVEPQITLDLGNLAVAWADGRGAFEQGTDPRYDDLYYNVSRDGAPFTPDADYRIDSMYDGGSFKEDLNFDVLGGTWYAAWTDGRNGTSDVYFQSLPIGTASQPPQSE